MKAFTEPGKQVQEFLDIFLVEKSLIYDDIRVNNNFDKANKINIVEISLKSFPIYKLQVYMKENNKTIVTGIVSIYTDYAIEHIANTFIESNLLLIKDSSTDNIIGFSSSKDFKKIFNIIKQYI